MERMLYCGFCGMRHKDTELRNASQRLKQDVVVKKWQMGYLWGGMAIWFLLYPLAPKMGIMGLFLLMIWYYFVLTAPFARSHAQKLHPEESSA